VSSFLFDLSFRRFGFPFVFLTMVRHSLPPGTESGSYQGVVEVMDYPNLILDIAIWYVTASVLLYVIDAGFLRYSPLRNGGT
jgi:hypothetical protein